GRVGENDAALEGDVVAHPVQPRVGVPHRGVHDDPGEDVADRLPREGVGARGEWRRPPGIDGEPGVHRPVLGEDRPEAGERRPLLELESDQVVQFFGALRARDSPPADGVVQRAAHVRQDVHLVVQPVVRGLALHVDDADTRQHQHPLLAADVLRRRLVDRPCGRCDKPVLSAEAGDFDHGFPPWYLYRLPAFFGVCLEAGVTPRAGLRMVRRPRPEYFWGGGVMEALLGLRDQLLPRLLGLVLPAGPRPPPGPGRTCGWCSSVAPVRSSPSVTGRCSRCCAPTCTRPTRMPSGAATRSPGSLPGRTTCCACWRPGAPTPRPPASSASPREPCAPTWRTSTPG